MDRAFDTKRLRVFVTEVKPTDHNDVKTLFVAFRTDEDRPMVAANMLLWDCPAIGGWCVEWHEVSSEHRRQGIATEFRAGIEKHLSCELISDPGSDDGEKFLESLNAKENITSQVPLAPAADNSPESER